MRKYETDSDDWVQVNEKYLLSFMLKRTEFLYEIHNKNTFGEVRPDFNIMVYDENGVSVAATSIHWSHGYVNPGKMKQDKKEAYNRISSKTPKYYKVTFD